MPDGEILQFARETPTQYLICRQGRHRYPYVAPKDKIYRRTRDGYDIFTVDCENCGQAYREERWTIREDKKGRVIEMRFWKATTKYHPQENGERSDYLLPKGAGFIPGSMLLEAHTTLQMVGGMVRRAG